MNDLEKETLKLERIKKRKEYQRKWAWENRDRLREQSRQRYLARREEILERCRKRHARLKNDSEYVEKKRMYARQRREEQKLWMRELKKRSPCNICGETRLPCLEYHHIDPSTKEFPISWVYGQTTGNKERILNEIKKCIVLCANCHRMEHSNERA